MKKIFIVLIMFLLVSRVLFSGTIDVVGKYPAAVNSLIGMGTVFVTSMVYDFVIYPERRYSGVDPRSSLIKSAVFPGWGQYANNRRAKGIVFSSIFSGLTAFYLFSDYNTNRNMRLYSSTGEDKYYTAYINNFNVRKYTFVAIVSFYVFNVLDAYVDAFFTNDRLEISGIGSGIKISYKMPIKIF